MYLGRTTAKELLSAAGDDRERWCEARFYAAEYQVLHNNRSEALTLFHSAIESKTVDLLEHVAAKAELKVLEGKKK